MSQQGIVVLTDAMLITCIVQRGVADKVVDAAMRATDGRIIAANATGCLEVFSTPYPETSWQLPWIHSLFGNTAAVATGIAANTLSG